MSKLQTALKKISSGAASRGGAGTRDEAGEASAAKSQAVARNHRPGPTGKERIFRQSVAVDYDALAAEGIPFEDEDDVSLLRNEMRRIKWPVLANAFGEQGASLPRGHIVMVTSAVAGEGKTFTSVNLALSIAAEKDFGVLLVDADVAKPHVSNLFGVEQMPGVIDYLAGEISGIEDIVVGTDVPRLSLISAGRSDPHASELIASKRMTSLVNELDALFPDTVILFDTPPILQTNESQVLSKVAGQVLLVVAANQTPQEAVVEAVSLLRSDGAVNVVFNGVRSLFNQKYQYGGYYGYGHPSRR